jgi:NAD(P)H-hydrate epimerase
LTPHVKEFERLTRIKKEEILKNPIKIVSDFVRHNDVCVLLKGAVSIIADRNECYINKTGTSGMAKGGSGDVLSGIITAFLASTEKRTVLESACLGAYVNGLAGELAEIAHSQITATPRDTVKYVPLAIEELIRSDKV